MKLVFIGDSGGPLYMWDEERAYLIGIVSRGIGCAVFNHAGIFTRVKKHLDWINSLVWESC